MSRQFPVNLDIAPEELMVNGVRWNELFSQWPQTQQDALIRVGRLVRYRRRTLVLSHDSHARELLLVVAGSVEISSVSATGRKYVNALMSPGQVAPLIRLLEDPPLPYSYYAHEDSVIIHLPSDAVVAVLDSNPVLWRSVALLALQRQRISVAMIKMLTLGSIRRRVAANLLILAEMHGTTRNFQTDMRVKLTQQDLAAMLGLSRQTVSKELGRLVEENVIEMAYKRVVIKDHEALRKVSLEES